MLEGDDASFGGLWPQQQPASSTPTAPRSAGELGTWQTNWHAHHIVDLVSQLIAPFASCFAVHIARPHTHGFTDVTLLLLLYTDLGVLGL